MEVKLDLFRISYFQKEIKFQYFDGESLILHILLFTSVSKICHP